MNDELIKLLGDNREENRVAEIAFVIRERGNYGDDRGERTAPAVHHAITIATALASTAELIKSLCEESCNRELTPREEATLARREAKFARIAELCGFKSRTGGDPRGACAYLIDPADETAGDGWGTGWAVYR